MTLGELLKRIIERFSVSETNAFLEAIQLIKDGIDMLALRDALERQDVDAAVDAMNIEPAVFNSMRSTFQEAYRQAGQATASHFPPPPDASLLLRFDMTNPRAEDWLRQYGAQKLVDMSDAQKALVREAILDGYSRGEGPDNMVVELAGRLNRQTGKRVGGVLGLTDLQASYVRSMRSRLQSGDPMEMSKVFGMSLRDRRYDRTIKKAVKEGKPLSPSKLLEMVNAYEARQLKARALTVGRTEVGMAVMASRMEAWRQGLDKTGYPEEAVLRRWRHGGGGEDPRPQHVFMNNQTVPGLTEKFIMPDGTAMLHAMDPAGGAKHCANCTCDTEFEIDYTYGVT